MSADGSLAATAPIAIALLAFVIWIYLFRFRGNFWRGDQRFRGDAEPPAVWPSIAIIIPARDEAETIGAVISALTTQEYPGSFRIFLVDDQSSDNTQEIARGTVDSEEKLTIIAGTPLPEGWTGKMWAVAQGIARAREDMPEASYYLLTDADIHHPQDGVRKLVAEADRDGLGLLSLMVTLRCKSGWEKLLIPAFIFFFQKLYPFSWINNPKRSTAGAAGGCMLVRRSTLEAAGGIDVVADRVIDDCALAAALKPLAPIRLYLSKETHSLRAYQKLNDIWRMVRRTAFVQLRHSITAVIGTVIAMLIIYWGPLVAAIWGGLTENSQLWVPGLAAWVIMIVVYLPTIARYRIATWQTFLLPIAALFYVAMTVDSARLHLFGQAPEWKGRRYKSAPKAVRS